MSGVRSRAIAAAGVSLAVVIGVAGCGAAKQLSAKQQVSEAFNGFSKANSAAFTVSLDTTVADFAAISKAEGDPMNAADRKTLGKILKGDILLKVQAPDGKTFGDTSKAGASSSQDLMSLLNNPTALSKLLKSQGSFSVAAELSGESLVDVRTVAGVVYVKANVKKILTLAGQDPKELDSALAELPPSLAPIAKAAKGEWVSLDLAKVAAEAKDSGLLAGLPTSAPTPSVDTAKVQKLLTDLKAAYQQKATITTLGNSAKGDGYRLGAPARQVAQAVSADLVSLLGESSGSEVKKVIAEIPDRTFSIDVYVKDDDLSAVSLDLTQFLKEAVPGRKLAVTIDVDVNGGTVEAPSGATEIDVKKLFSDIPAGLGLGGAGLDGLTYGSDSGSGTGAGGLFGGGDLTKAQIKELKKAGMTDAQIKELEKEQSGSN